MRGILVLVILLPALALQPAAAQHVSLAPTIGFYLPTQDLVDITSGTANATGKVEAGFSFGGRLGLWFGSRVGLEASGNYVPTTYALTSGSSQVTKEDAKLFNGAAQLVVFLLPRTSPLTLYVNGGVGVVSHGGVAFTGASKTSNVSGVFGAGAGINLGGLQLTAGADLFAYSADYSGATQVTTSLSQKDIQLRFGFGLPFGGQASGR